MQVDATGLHIRTSREWQGQRKQANRDGPIGPGKYDHRKLLARLAFAAIDCDPLADFSAH
jgi:hypothetical protein